MRLLENDKFLNVQSGKKYAYLKAYMSGPAKRRGSGASTPPPTLKKKLYRNREKERKKERIVTFQRHKIMLIWS